jgi:hypothetical protein
MFRNRNDNRREPVSLPARHTGRRVVARRGVSSVLAMMFVVVFGSLTAVMAIVAQGNLRTAHSGLQLSRAMSAAETGLVFAARRLEAQGARFVTEKGVIDVPYGEQLWLGTWDEAATGPVEVMPAAFVESTIADSVAAAVLNAHLADAHAFAPTPADGSLPSLDAVEGTTPCISGSATSCSTPPRRPSRSSS